MIELRTLGRLELAGASGEAAAQVIGQPKRAGLLVYLALAGQRGFHRRDNLIAMFWPEMETTKARQSLRQVVYMLRRAMGREVVLSRGDEELAVNRELLCCDALIFEEAIGVGKPETVLDCYAGDFLAGFFVSGAAPEFDEWVASERQRLRAMAASGAWAVALQEERASNAAGAAHWARRAVSFTPDDEAATRDLMLLLARVGDRSGALRAYDQLAGRLRSEFDALPAPEISKLAEAMRNGAAAYAPPLRPGLEGPAIPGPRALVPRLPRRRTGWVVAALGALAVAAGVAVAALVSSSPETPIFAVGEIRDHTRPDSSQHASAFADLLATSIARLSQLEVIGSPRLYDIQGQGLALDSSFSLAEAARSAGAGGLLEGDLRRAGSGLVLDLRMIDLPSGRIRHVLRAAGSDPFDLADRVATVLATELKIAPPRQPLSVATTRSLVALRLYEQGLSAYYSADFGAARRLFSAAFGEDSTFTMAAFYLARASGFPDSILQIADRLASRATDHDRLLIRGSFAQWRMLPASSAYAETLAVRFPSDVDGQLALAQTRWWTGDNAGAVEAYHNVLRIDSLSINREGVLCRACEAYGGLADAYRSWDSLPAALRISREWVARSPRSPPAWSVLAATLEAVGSQEYLAASRVVDSLMNQPSRIAFSQAYLSIREGRYASAEAAFRGLLASNDGPAGDYRWYLVIVLWQQGRLREALEWTSAPALESDGLLRAQTLFLIGRYGEAAQGFLDLAGPPAPLQDGHSARHATWNRAHVATVSAAAGDTARLAALADTIEQSGARSLFGRDLRLHHYVRGLLARARGDLASAEREFRLAVHSWNMGYTRINYELGKVLLETGRPSEAVRVLQPAFRGSIESSNLYITRTELHEMLARAWDAAGNRDSARAHWRAVVDAWRGADPQFQPRWQAALAALAH